MAVGPKQTSPGAFSVLPLPPLEYDVQYQNQIIRILNFIIQQLQTPGAVRTDSLTVTDRDQDTQFIVNPKELTETLTILAKNLPTTTTATVDTQIWNDGGFLKILPAGNPGNLNADTVTANHVHVTDEVTANTVSATTSVSTATVNATTVDATTVNATTVTATGAVSGNTLSATTSVSGNTLSATTSVSAASAGITGAVSAGSVTSTGTVHGNALTATTSVSAASGSITGTLSAGAVTSTGTISGNALSASTSVSAASASISGNVGAGSVSASSSVSGNSVSASYLTSGTLTLNSIPTSPSGPSGTVWRDGSGYLRIV